MKKVIVATYEDPAILKYLQSMHPDLDVNPADVIFLEKKTYDDAQSDSEGNIFYFFYDAFNTDSVSSEEEAIKSMVVNFLKIIPDQDLSIALIFIPLDKLDEFKKELKKSKIPVGLLVVESFSLSKDHPENFWVIQETRSTASNMEIEIYFYIVALFDPKRIDPKLN